MQVCINRYSLFESCHLEGEEKRKKITKGKENFGREKRKRGIKKKKENKKKEK